MSSVTTFPALPAGTWTSIAFSGTADNGFAAGDTYHIYQMTAGVWSATPMTAPTTNTHTLRKIVFPSPSVGYACGDNISILKWTAVPGTWTQQLPNPATFATSVAFHSIHFPVDTMNGWAVGDGGLIVNTTDGGANWNRQATPTPEDLYDVWFTDNSTGFAAGNHGMILRTADGGATWLRAPPVGGDPLVQLNAVDFSNNGSIGLAVGATGTILLTLDGGASWVPQTNPSAADLFGVSVPKTGSGSVAYACGASGTILKTANLTAATPTWTSSTPGGANTLRAILFPTGDTTGYACGDGTTLLHTTDGATWNAED